MKKFSLNQRIEIEKFPISQLSIVIEILKTYNCRSNEVLNAKWNNYFPNQFLILDGSKKSSNVIIRDRFILSLIDNLPHFDSVLIFPSVSYNILYHHVKAYYSHLFVKFKKRKYFRVTHGFRYSAVSKLDNEEKIRDILHHRSVKSGKFYKSIKEVQNVPIKALKTRF